MHLSQESACLDRFLNFKPCVALVGRVRNIPVSIPSKASEAQRPETLQIYFKARVILVVVQ